jgi:cobalt/nickel transport protein
MKGQRGWVLGTIGVSLAIAALLSPWASPWPDGLEHVAQTVGFSHRAFSRPVVPAPLPDYTVPVLGSGRLSTAAAGVTGTLLVLALAWGWGRLLGGRRPEREETR